MPENDTTNHDPSQPSAAVIDMAEPWPLIDALMGGTAAMRKAGRKYLPQWPSECDESYECRRRSAVLFPAYSRTVSVLVGKPFSKPLTVGDDVPERLREMLDDIDLEGRNLHSFAMDVVSDALAYGISGILVDCPPARGARTVEEERRAGIRPYFIHVKHDAILGWRSEKRGSAMTLTQLRLMESVEVLDGAFGTKFVQQVRVLEPGRWATYRKAKGPNGADAWTEHEAGETSIDFIPFVPVYGRRKDFMVGEPPMLDLAYLNVEHWQSKSDQQTILHVARVPILLVTGFENDGDENMAIGAGAMMKSRSKDANARFVEHTGAAIEAGRLSILDTEDQMRQTGAELTVVKPGNTTIVQTRSDNEPGMCDLQRITQGAEDGLDTALFYAAVYMGLPEGGHVSIYSDFGVTARPEASAGVVVELMKEGFLTQATGLAELKRREYLGPDVDVPTEAQAAYAERKAAQEAAADRERDMLLSSLAERADREMAGGGPGDDEGR